MTPPAARLVLLLAAGLVATGPLLAGAPWLAGRTIVLDPGHGGTASGMVGPGGTREADLNLAVARALAAGLTRLGATVVMTRTADGDLLARPAPLKDELRARAALAGSVEADLFVSLHHNATPDNLGPVDLLHRNRSEVYLKLDDEASPELGARLLAALRSMTRSPRSQLYPSNFSVLRNNVRPAVLGEPFYLSIDLWERYAARPGFAELEADRYARAIEGFLGAEARPSVRLLAPYPGEVLTALDLTAQGEASWAAGRAPDRPLRFTLDGQPAEPRLDWLAGGRFRAVFPRISQGSHELSVVTVDSLARVSASERRSLEVSAPPAELVLSAVGPGHGAPRLLEVLVRDRHGRSVRDGTQVVLASAPAASVRTTAGGVAMFLLGPGASGAVRVEAGGRSSSLGEPPRAAGATAWSWGRATDARSGASLPALAVAGAERSRYSTEDGVYVCQSPAAAGPLRFESPGYVPRVVPSTAAGGALDVALEPVLEGALRGSKVSLDVSGQARALLPALEAALAACGAAAEPRPEPAVADRVRASNARHDDLYLLLATASQAGRVTFYAASPRGRALAQAVAGVLGLSSPVEGGDYVLSNTGGTTVAVGLPAGREPAALAIGLVSGLARGLAALRPADRVRPSPARRRAANDVVRDPTPGRLTGGILLTADGRLEPVAAPTTPSTPGELIR